MCDVVWREKEQESALTKCFTSQESPTISSSTEVEDSNEEADTDVVDSTAAFVQNVQSYIDLISDEPLSSKKDSETGKKFKLTKLIDKKYVENLFVDSNESKPTSTSTKKNIGKLSKSLDFLNEPSNFNRKPKNPDYNMILTNNNRKKVGLFNANYDSPIEEEVKNKVKKKLFEDPWKTISIEKQEPIVRSSDKRKFWKPPKPPHAFNHPSSQKEIDVPVLYNYDTKESFDLANIQRDPIKTKAIRKS